MLCVFVLFAVISSVHAAETDSAKRVLIISTGSRFSAGFAVAHERILEALGKIPSVRIETYGEDLDILRFQTERFQRLFGEYLADKCADRPPCWSLHGWMSRRAAIRKPRCMMPTRTNSTKSTGSKQPLPAPIPEIREIRMRRPSTAIIPKGFPPTLIQVGLKETLLSGFVRL